jgi:YVTN family beta-propeller protein
MRSWTRRILLAALPALAMLPIGCGGGGGGSSSGSTPAVTVSPAATIISVNGTQQFTPAVAGVPTIAIASNGAVRAANVATITTTAAHNLASSQSVSIAGVTDATFNGTFIVTAVPSSTTFTYAQSGLDATSGGGTVTNNAVNWFVNTVAGGDLTVGKITPGGLYTAPAALPPAVTATIAAKGAVRAANVVTITTTAAHNLVAGQVVVITDVVDTTFNDTFLIASVPSTTTFTFNQTANDATSGPGKVSSFAVTIKATSVASSSTSGTAVASILSGITVSVTPPNATVGTSETFQFTSNVTGSANTAVNWFVNGIAGGQANVGTISASGLYTAPASPPTSNAATIASNGAVRKSNVVTITTTAPHGFSVGQSVIIAGVSDTSFNGTFTIASVPSSSTFTYAQTGTDTTTPSGGGTATSVSNAVTIKAVSVADSSRSATVGAAIISAVDPTLTSISPTVLPQGAVFQDVYLTGMNLISTTTVRVSGVIGPCTTDVFQSNSSTLRVRLHSNCLASPATLSIDAERQNGTTTPPQTVTVATVRPALVGASPDSGKQGGAAVSFNINGGYFGPSASPIVQVEFAGSGRSTTVNLANEGRQANVTIGSADLSEAGLFPVGVRSVSNLALFAATNFAVQPSATPTVLVPPTIIPVGSQPSSIAVNQGTGVAVVSNRCSNSMSRIDVATLATIGAAIPVGTYPTGVAVDDIRHLAVVVNNGSNVGCPGSPPPGTPSLSIVDLAAGSVSATVTSNVGPAPFSVGVNPLTGLALVTYQNSNRADILDLTQTPPAIVSTTTISTGGNPQVAVNPRLNWAVVTPGGAGALSIVDLSRRLTASIAATNGVSRANGITTVTTTAAHPFQQNQVVLVSVAPGADTSFNGIFVINSVPSSTTFTYVQSGAPSATSGGGSIVTTPPVANPVAVGGITARGIAINSFTQRAILTDPVSGNLTFFSLLDQVVPNPLGLSEIGAAAAAFNPYTDIAVTVNPNTNQASVIDPRTPARLATLTVGAGPRAVAIDAGTNTALVVNETDGTVTPIGLGAIRSLHIAAISLPVDRQLAPEITFTSTSDLQMTLLGKGFVSGSKVRLNGAELTPSSITDRQLKVTVPAGAPLNLLAGPSRYVVDVLNPGGTQSNVLELAVVQKVDLVGAGGGSCTAPAPAAVAIDQQRDLAVVTNSGCNNASVVDLNTGTITATVSVDVKPSGVAISSRLGMAVVSNNGAGKVSVIDLTTSPPSVKSTVSVGTQPLGVAINEATGVALVANAGSASMSIVDLTSATPGLINTVILDRIPQAVAVDPARGIAAVADAGANNLTLVNLNSASIVGRVPAQLPTAVVFDPVTGQFITNASTGNLLVAANPDTLQSTGIKSSINPTSIAYNFASGTLVTVNTASGTFSVMDMVEQRIRIVLAISGSPQFSVDIHPRTNMAVIADQANNRLLLFLLPN